MESNKRMWEEEMLKAAEAIAQKYNITAADLLDFLSSFLLSAMINTNAHEDAVKSNLEKMLAEYKKIMKEKSENLHKLHEESKIIPIESAEKINGKQRSH